jgi:nucleotide-binding universal stress UspA family protein
MHGWDAQSGMALLIPYDGSKPAHDAVQHAIREHGDKEMVLLKVVEAAGGTTTAGINLAQEKLKELREEGNAEISDELEDELTAADVDFRIDTVVGKPAREIVTFAEENDVEHIVIGSHGRSGISRVVLGSVAEKVVRRAPMPVTVVREIMTGEQS